MNVLFLTHRLPFAPNRGDRIRAFHVARYLAPRTDLHIVSLVHDRAEEAQADSLRRLGIRVSTAPAPRVRNRAGAAVGLLTARPLTHFLLDSPALPGILRRIVRERRPDVVLAYCSGAAAWALEPPLADVPLVLDLVDVDSAKWAALASKAVPPLAWVYRREAKCLARFERRAAEAARATIVVNERERAALLRVCPTVAAHVVPNGLDVDAFRPIDVPASSPRVVFPAVFNYAPNVDGALWFAEHVWPRVRAQVPGAVLTLAGASPAASIRRLTRRDASIEVTGAVDDIRPYLWRSAVAVAPIFTARGVQNKVLEAAASGLPAVVTREVWEGLPAEVMPACQLVETSEAFTTAIVALLGMSPAERRRTADSARLASLAWPQRLTRLAQLLESAAATRAACA